MKILPFILFAVLPCAAIAETEVLDARTMAFDDCLKIIRNVASDLRVIPINIVETDELRMVRFLASDASLLVTCSKPDRKMVINRTTYD